MMQEFVLRLFPHPEVSFHKVKSLEGAAKCASPILRGIIFDKAPQHEGVAQIILGMSISKLFPHPEVLLCNKSLEGAAKCALFSVGMTK